MNERRERRGKEWDKERENKEYIFQLSNNCYLISLSEAKYLITKCQYKTDLERGRQYSKNRKNFEEISTKGGGEKK